MQLYMRAARTAALFLCANGVCLLNHQVNPYVTNYNNLAILQTRQRRPTAAQSSRHAFPTRAVSA